MSVVTELQAMHCVPCEGGTPPLSKERVQALLLELPQWKLREDGKHIHREWRVKDFAAGLDFLSEIGDIAEEEGHHPDLHLTGYKNVAVDLTTHAAKGLTENDFILAAKIDALPVVTKE
jgi:4a-hydroxytetrahydrobiopterin dehydratase